MVASSPRRKRVRRQTWLSITCLAAVTKLLFLLDGASLVTPVSAVPNPQRTPVFPQLNKHEPTPVVGSGNSITESFMLPKVHVNIEEQPESHPNTLRTREDGSDTISLSGSFSTSISIDTETYDVVILGATPAGIMTAVSASRVLSAQNKRANILILERTGHIGGLPANGLGATDIHTKGATGGLFLEFVDRILKYYIDTYGAGSQQVLECSGGYRFEPKVAARVFQEMIGGEGGRITIRTQRQFDSAPENLVVDQGNGIIKSMKVQNRNTRATEAYSAKYFVDATYEGDLIAAAKVPYFIGREGKEKYNEIGAGKVYKYWKGPEMGGTTHAGDKAIQAYNYRLCLTTNSANRVPIPRPQNYDRTEYLSLIRDIVTGCHTGVEAQSFCPGGQAPMPSGDWFKTPPSKVAPGAPRGIARLTSIVNLPNGKTDANNQHLAFLSTDLPEENWAYPTGSWEWRDQFAQRLRDYTVGLFYFAQNDEAVPLWFRALVKGVGFAKDEYEDNEYFPRQIYVREGRRMKGRYIFTANDALSASIHKDSITASHYALDSHAVRKRELGRVHLDGFVSYDVPKPYTVPIGVMIPSTADGGINYKNLLAPVPISGSHIGFSTLRMEPCWMALGQAAGTVAGLLLAAGKSGSVLDVDISQLQSNLLDQGAVLVWGDELHGKSVQERKKLQLEWLGGVSK